MQDDPPKAPWWRMFDRDYWMMRSALGYPVPHRVDALWSRSLGHKNTFRCGKCEARRQFPGVHIAQAIFDAHDHYEPHVWEDVQHRVSIAMIEVQSHDRR